MLKNLLIVEDNLPMRRLIKSVVEDLASSVNEYTDEAEALNAYETHYPEWALMDVEMERMDGLTATRKIMTMYPKAKIMILTKYGTEQMRKAARRAGAREYVLKENLLKIRGILQ